MNTNVIREKLHNLKYHTQISTIELSDILSSIINLIEQRPKSFSIISPGDKVLIKVDENVDRDAMLFLLNQWCPEADFAFIECEDIVVKHKEDQLRPAPSDKSWLKTEL